MYIRVKTWNGTNLYDFFSVNNVMDSSFLYEFSCLDFFYAMTTIKFILFVLRLRKLFKISADRSILVNIVTFFSSSM